MGIYYLSNKAVEDLSEIWEYTYEVWSEDQADIYYNSLLSSCQDLADNPQKGKPYHNICENLLGFFANKHIIFYKVIDENEIEVFRILHEKMDLKNRLKD
jgi:toxin ParE1/3/4